MNILIVDDNKNNRMILRLLLEDYMDDNPDVDLSLDEAEDGIQAVEKCKQKHFSIIPMDIMMPNMDGIEATKIIRANDDKIMIIAVSAVDDSDRKKLILNNGAEDYVAKPVNSDIFLSRIENYITLVEAREHKHNNLSKINLFSSEIFSRHTNFIMNSEDSLSEFWEYFLLESEHKCDNLSDVVRTLFAIADTQLRLSINSEIYIEDSEDIKYFTLTKLDELPPKIVTLILNKNSIMSEYKISKDRISFELKKIFSDEQEIQSNIVKSSNEVVKEEVKELPLEIEEEEIASPVDFISQKLEVFDYMDEDDLYDLEDYAGKLNSLMLVVGSGDVGADEITEIYTYLERIGSILATYSEIYPISKALNELAADMASHIDEFTQNSEALGPMCKAFSNDMSSWIQMSFHTGAPSVDFMNDTIAVNCQTIGGMLKMDEASNDEDFDDIFDF